MACPVDRIHPANHQITSYDPTDPTSVWYIAVHPEVANWRTSAIRVCLQFIRAGQCGLESWLTAVDQCVQRRTGQRLDKVAGGWRQKARERCRPAYEDGHWEAAATELVYYLEEIVCIYRRRLQGN
jgi:hypothetical protein